MSSRNGHLPPRDRGRDGLHILQHQDPLLQRPDLPREQVAHRQSRRDPRTAQPGLLHYQAARGHPGDELQAGRQGLHWR